VSDAGFVELKTTDGQTVLVRPNSIGAIEVAPSSARVEGHLKLYVEGYKFLVQIEKDELLAKLKESEK
jgi:predicted amidophosphoribosyltransferase